MSVSPASSPSGSFHDDQWVEEGPWLTRVAWPQVVTIGGISLAVLLPLLAAFLLA
jgi:hypothetical protein